MQIRQVCAGWTLASHLCVDLHGIRAATENSMCQLPSAGERTEILRASEFKNLN